MLVLSLSALSVVEWVEGLTPGSLLHALCAVQVSLY
jgi:hypothetical protein